MKRLRRFALALALLLALAGCAQKGSAPAAEEPAETPPEAGKAASEEDSAPDERPEVENNGGTFVRVGEKIWFRYYDEGAIDESCLWGEFLSTMPSHPVSSKLCFYDTEGDAIMEALPDDGFGGLWFGRDGFYLTRPKGDGGSEAYFKTLDGAETVLGEGTVVGVSDNGRFAAVQNGNALDVYEGAKALRGVVREQGLLAFCALTDDGELLFYHYDYDNGVGTLNRADEQGSSDIIGTLPALPEGIGSYCWEPEQCLVNGNDVWCAFGAYEGTGHFLADVLVVRAELDAGNGAQLAEIVEDEAETEYPVVPRLYLGADGAVKRAEHAPGDPALSEGAWGDLLVYGENGDANVVEEGFLSGVSDEGEMGYIVQSMETVGTAAYLTVARACRDPENDIGWRMAYLPETIYYLRAPLGGGVETLYGPQWNPRPRTEQVYADFAGVWTLTAVEVEGDRGDALPAGMTETVEFRADELRVIIDSSNGQNSYYNDFDHAEVLPAGGMGESFGLLLTSEGTDDMMWAYLDGDTLVATVLMHSDGEHGGDAVSRTGFYERAAD